MILKNTDLGIGDVRLVTANRKDKRRGLLGYVKLTLAGRIGLDGITLRRTAGGKLTLSFPARKDLLGFEHPFVRPLDDDTRLEIEQKVFAALGLEALEP